MSSNKQTHKRRLETFDYSSNGCYFLTFNSFQNRLLFGDIRTLGVASDHFADMILNENGRDVETAIKRACNLYPQIELDCGVIMPNHVHLLIVVNNESCGMQSETIPLVSKFVGAIKCRATKLIRKRMPNAKIWSNSYYDHIVRDDKDLQRIREYIANNPAKWANNKYLR